MQHKVEICGVNTAKLKVLKSSETQALLLRAKEGDMQAREELIAGNLRLLVCESYAAIYRQDGDVISVVRVFHGRQDFLRILFSGP